MTLVFNPAAFKHTVTEQDVETALATALFDELISVCLQSRLLCGQTFFDSSGNLIEVLKYCIIW
jgi:hypothetical protein